MGRVSDFYYEAFVLPSLGAKHLAATATTGCQYAAAVFCGHTLAKAMNLATLTLLGLISTEHL